MESRELDIAYCAGLFDGEGCISVTAYEAERHVRTRFNNTLWLGMQNHPTLNFFQRTMGTGNISRRKDVWMWNVSGPKAIHVGRVLVPYLHAKLEAMRLFLDFAATFNPKGPKPTPIEVVEKRMTLAAAIHDAMKRDTRAFHTNGIKSVNLSEGDNTEPSSLKGMIVGETVHRLGGEEPTNKPPTNIPPEREEIVGTAS